MKIEIKQSFYKGFIIFFNSFYFRLLFDTSCSCGFCRKNPAKIAQCITFIVCKTHLHTRLAYIYTSCEEHSNSNNNSNYNNSKCFNTRQMLCKGIKTIQIRRVAVVVAVIVFVVAQSIRQKQMQTQRVTTHTYTHAHKQTDANSRDSDRGRRRRALSHVTLSHTPTQTVMHVCACSLLVRLFTKMFVSSFC